jgi:hypothetical protein
VDEGEAGAMAANIIWLSVGIVALLLTGFHLVLRLSREVKGLYRLYVLVFLSVWSTVLWHRTYAPTTALLVGSIVIVAVLWTMAFIRHRPPRNRRETKRLLEHLQGEKRLEKFFSSYGNRLFWPLLAILLLSVCYRLLSFYDPLMI